MELNNLSAISPIDGRYRNQTEILSNYFSEYALIKYRVTIEIEYFISLCKIPLPALKKIKPEEFEKLRSIYLEFCIADAEKIKQTEKVTNHDVKAVEYFIKEKFDDLNLSDCKEFIHFGLTSQDINNTAVPLSLKNYFKEIYLPEVNTLVEKLKLKALEWKTISMLARTHGQPASPTILGKEIMVFVERMNNQLKQIEHIPFGAKFGGATGNLNAHQLAYPEINWIDFSNSFLQNSFGLQRQQNTTQIEHYDNMAALFDCVKRINTIMIDFSRDIWMYISVDYFKQKIKEGEVGSSAMPHKVNPIDFENAEGNLGYANAIFEHLSSKLPVSRLQRDLTDSTVLRNIGVPFAHTLISINSIIKGIDKLVLNNAALESDLEKNWAVVAEAIQTILRREGYPKPYEALKELTRTNAQITRITIQNFIDTLKVSEAVKIELKNITPHNYTGVKFL
jgi:adenylosuccinate lyase